jgi:uncharacterized membrane protein HdeD (DUF308 family)
MIDKNEMKRERAQAVAAGVRAGVSRKLGSIWWAFLLRGIFATALGIFALFWPTMSLSALAFAVGLYCVADGAAGLVGALRYPELREYFVQALVVIGIGAVLIFWPGATLRILLLFLGVAALFAGIGQFLTARRIPADDPERGVVMTIGIVAAIVGLVLVFWPGSGVVVISWVIGIAAILIGVLLIYLGSRFKRLEARVGMRT